jgi:ketosteroid isomerase-like protein
MNVIRLFGITATLLVLSLLHINAAADTTAIQSAVRAVLDQQVKDWNAGDVVKFMRGYDRSEKTRFASGGNITLGWQAVLERYQRTYSDKAAMGTLTFSDIDITVASEDTALAFGRWHLKREKDEPSGLFTLLFRKTADGWKIVHDHTSSAERKVGD